MKRGEAITLIVRYVILVALGFGVQLFYLAFSPLTVYPVFGIISLAYDNVALLSGNLLFFGNSFYAQIIPACVAGAAYFLLLILNLTTPMRAGKRIKSLVFLFVTFLVLNIIRIAVFAALLSSGYQYFDLTHKMVLYFGSTILVVIIWFVNVLIFKIRGIPIYTDFKNLFADASARKRE